MENKNKFNLLIYLSIQEDDYNIQTFIDITQIDTLSHLFKILASALCHNKTGLDYKYSKSELAYSKYFLEILYEDIWIKLTDLRAFYFFISSCLHLNEKIKINFKKIGKYISFSIISLIYQYR